MMAFFERNVSGPGARLNPARRLCTSQTMAEKTAGPQLELIAAAITKEEEGPSLRGEAN